MGCQFVAIRSGAPQGGLPFLFGYIKPFEPQLRVCELEQYKAVYCGLCRGLSRSFGPAARLTLSYDFTFIAMLHAALSDEIPQFLPRRCPCHPFVKRAHLEPCESIAFSCDIAMLLLREKCVDNRDDSSFPASLVWNFLLPAATHCANEAARKRSSASSLAREMTAAQRNAESLGDAATIDQCCDPTASALGGILELTGHSDEERRILRRLGYMLGRYIYLCDAVDDLPEDLEHGGFNPLKSRAGREEQAQLLRQTIAEIGTAYALLSPKYFQGILDNIVFLGLPRQAELVLEGEHHHE